MIKDVLEIIVPMIKQLSCWIGFVIIGVDYFNWQILPNTWYGALIAFVFGYGWYFLFWNIWTKWVK